MNYKHLTQLLLISLLVLNSNAFAAKVITNTHAHPQAKTATQPLTDIGQNNVYTQDKQTIQVSASHPEFVLRLKSNPTTGYSWFLREYDSNLIVPVKHNFDAPQKELIGSSGFEDWTFRVKPAAFIVPQQTLIRLIYMRPWQNSDAATQIVFKINTTK